MPMNNLLKVLVYSKKGKTVLWLIYKIGLSLIGKPGAIGTLTSGLFKSYIDNILSLKSSIYNFVSSKIDYISSVGGFVALFITLGVNKRLKDTVTIKY